MKTRGLVNLCFLLFVAVAFALPTVAGVPRWIEAFQSSPAAYGVGAPAQDTAARTTTVSGTLRFQVTPSVGGSQIRIRFSNETGTRPLKISAAGIALSAGNDGIASGTTFPVTFGGATSVTIPAGAPMLSDAIPLPIKAGRSLLISASLPEGIDLDSYGATGMWIAPGDQTQAAAMTNSGTVIGRPVVTGLSVLAAQHMPVIVALGDSITAGGRKTAAESHGWPERLAQRLNASGDKVAIVNAGIAGNRVLSDGYGQAALARLDRDVLRIDGLSTVIVFEGINDIGFPGRRQFATIQPDIRAEDLIAAYSQIVARVHARGGRVIGATLLPFEDAFYYTPAKEEMRRHVNAWIRSPGSFDSVVDLDAVMRDPDRPARLSPAFDSGDHLHPNAAGEQVIADAIDPRLF